MIVHNLREKAFVKVYSTIGPVANIWWTDKEVSGAEGEIFFAKPVNLPCQEPFDVNITKLNGYGGTFTTQLLGVHLLEVGGLKKLASNKSYKFIAKETKSSSRGHYYDAVDEGETERVTVSRPVKE